MGLPSSIAIRPRTGWNVYGTMLTTRSAPAILSRSAAASWMSRVTAVPRGRPATIRAARPGSTSPTVTRKPG